MEAWIVLREQVIYRPVLFCICVILKSHTCRLLQIWQFIIYGSLDSRKQSVPPDTARRISNRSPHWITFEKSETAKRCASLRRISLHFQISPGITRWGKQFKILNFSHSAFYYPPFHF